MGLMSDDVDGGGGNRNRRRAAVPRLRTATTAANQPEAELYEGLLREAAIPFITRRTGGADVPDFLAAGAREILVPADLLSRARLTLNLVPSADPAPFTADPAGVDGASEVDLADRADRTGDYPAGQARTDVTARVSPARLAIGLAIGLGLIVLGALGVSAMNGPA